MEVRQTANEMSNNSMEVWQTAKSIKMTWANGGQASSIISLFNLQQT